MAKLDGPTIAGCQLLILAAVAAVPDRPDRMDYMLCRQPIAFGDLGAAGLAAAKDAALFEKPRAGAAMNRAVDAAATKQRRVGGVDDGVNAQCGNVGDDNFQPQRPQRLACDVANAVRRRCQA